MLEILFPFTPSLKSTEIALFICPILGKFIHYHVKKETKGYPSITRILHKIIPISWQQNFRDSGGFRIVSDISVVCLGATLFFFKPSLLTQYYRLSNKILQKQYGETKSHRIEIIPGDIQDFHSEIHRINVDNELHSEDSTLIFVHGGAWGSGSIWKYRLIAEGLRKTLNSSCVISVGYPVYPASTINQQSESIVAAIRNITNKQIGKSPRYILAGHSSGANISALALLQLCNRKLQEEPIKIDLFIGLSGVYDIGDHYQFEANRGVHVISPMSAAAEGQDNFGLWSPTYLLSSSKKYKKSKDDASLNAHLRYFYEHFPNCDRFPRTVLLHGLEDTTVPHTSSQLFAIELRESGVETSELYLNYGHADPILDMFLPANPLESETGKALRKELNLHHQ